MIKRERSLGLRVTNFLWHLALSSHHFILLSRGRPGTAAFTIFLKFEPRDLWVGLYWKVTGDDLDVYICLLPCLPIHVWYSPADRLPF